MTGLIAYVRGCMTGLIAYVPDCMMGLIAYVPDCMTGLIAYVPGCMTGLITYVPECMMGLIAYVPDCMLLGLEKKKLVAVADNWNIIVTCSFAPFLYAFLFRCPSALRYLSVLLSFAFTSTPQPNIPTTVCCSLLVSSLCPLSPNVKAFIRLLKCCAQFSVTRKGFVLLSVTEI